LGVWPSRYQCINILGTSLFRWNWWWWGLGDCENNNSNNRKKTYCRYNNNNVQAPNAAQPPRDERGVTTVRSAACVTWCPGGMGVRCRHLAADWKHAHARAPPPPPQERILRVGRRGRYRIIFVSVTPSVRHSRRSAAVRLRSSVSLAPPRRVSVVRVIEVFPPTTEILY